MSEEINKKEIEDQIVEVLKTIYDPEIPVDIFELGLIYEIIIDNEANVTIRMTLTSPSCPVAESLPKEVEEKVNEIWSIKHAIIDLTFDPPWEMGMMSEEAKLELGFI